MIDKAGAVRMLETLVVPQWGRLESTGDRYAPYRLLDDADSSVEAVTVYFRDLLAAGCAPATVRSYGMDLLRWWRFLVAVEVAWDRADRAEARDFMLWLRVAEKPYRPHWRRQGDLAEAAASAAVRTGVVVPGTPNAVTGRAAPGRTYAVATRAHAETVLRAFYDFHLEHGTGPLLNPFPLDSRRRGRAHEHHNPMQPFTTVRVGRYRPRIPARLPRRIPDDRFDELFAGLNSHRDRALLAFWISTGARAQELLHVCRCDADPGRQTIAVVRKGSRIVQELPAAADAFVWLRLYQHETRQQGAPDEPGDPLWWTLRRPWRPLSYPAARMMFGRANQLLGANWTLHDLRHTAAYRMARDPQMPLTDVQWVLGHASLSTTQLYIAASQDEIIETVLAHHVRHATAAPVPPVPAAGYNPASLDVLFGNRP